MNKRSQVIKCFFLTQQTIQFSNEFYQLISQLMSIIIGGVVAISTIAFPVILKQRNEGSKYLKSKVSRLEEENQELNGLRDKLTKIETICETALGASDFTGNSDDYHAKVVSDIQGIIVNDGSKQKRNKTQRKGSKR
ncbi:MAG: hypothetical protein F6K48_15915 [Okeania sp. SIO3H1]|nr:hypothetical protein [Okeania sp. SIO3H1]